MANKQIIKEMIGAIFDVDDTLLDNFKSNRNLHFRSRSLALKTTAQRHNLPALATVTAGEDMLAFKNAQIHSMEGAIWEILRIKGIVANQEPDLNHVLVKEITELRNQYHPAVLRQYGRPVPGVVRLVEQLAHTHKLHNHMTIASSADHRDIDIFLDDITQLRQFFPHERIVAKQHIPAGMGKPHPEPFHRAFASLGLHDSQRHRVIAFEDDPRGVRSAKAAGLFVCAITTRHVRNDPSLLAAKPDIIIDSYNELL